MLLPLFLLMFSDKNNENSLSKLLPFLFLNNESIFKNDNPLNTILFLTMVGGENSANLTDILPLLIFKTMGEEDDNSLLQFLLLAKMLENKSTDGVKSNENFDFLKLLPLLSIFSEKEDFDDLFPLVILLFLINQENFSLIKDNKDYSMQKARTEEGIILAE